MLKVKTAELTGAALDWAVAKCEGAAEEWRSDAPFLWDGVPCIRMDGHDVNYRPSTSWLIAGPIIERCEMALNSAGIRTWMAKTVSLGRLYDGVGPTMLIAALRCYVASKLGDTVEIPKELTQC